MADLSAPPRGPSGAPPGRPGAALLVAAALALAAAGVVRYATVHGIGATPDSTIYVAAARQLAAGAGVSVPTLTGARPLAHYPPMYPAALAAGALAGVDPLAWAPWLHAGLFGLNVALVAAILWWYARSVVPAAAGGALVLLSEDMLRLHTQAVSEPLFFTGVLLSLGLLAVAIERGRLVPLAAAGAAAGFASVTRYAALPLLATGGLAVLALWPGRLRTRLTRALAFGIVATAPPALWLLRNAGLGGSLTGRAAGFHPPRWWHVQTAAAAVGDWVSPLHALGTAPALLVLAAAVALGIWAFVRLPVEREAGADRARVLPAVAGIFGAVYILFLLTSITFFDPATPLDARLLAAAYLALVLAGVALAWRSTRADAIAAPRTRTAVRGALMAALAYLLVADGVRARAWLADVHAHGQGYNYDTWRTSRILETIRLLPPDVVIFTNNPDPIMLQCARPTLRLPRMVPDAGATDGATIYRPELDAMVERLRASNGIIAYFTDTHYGGMPPEPTLRRVLPLRVMYEGPDGAMFTLAPPAAAG